MSSMPFNSNESLPKEVQSLPAKAKTIWRKAFNSAFQQGGDETRAFKIAWGAVKRVFKKKDGAWVMKSMIQDQVFVPFEVKSDDKGNFFVEGFLSATGLDSVNDFVTKSCLDDMFKQIPVNGDISVISEKNIQRINGGIEHEHVLADKRIIPTLKIVDKKIITDGNREKLFIRAQLNKHSERFEEIKGSIEDGFLTGFSIEFRPMNFKNLDNGVRVLDKIKLGGFALTGRPACPACTLTDFFIKSRGYAEMESKFETVRDTPVFTCPHCKAGFDMLRKGGVNEEPAVMNEGEVLVEEIRNESKSCGCEADHEVKKMTEQEIKQEEAPVEAPATEAPAEEAPAEAPAEEAAEEAPAEEEVPAEEEPAEEEAAEESTEEATEGEEVKSITLEDVRSVIKEELKSLKVEPKNLVAKEEKFETKSEKGFNFMKSFEGAKR